MALIIRSIGKWKPSPEKELFEEYQKRLHGKISLEEYEAKKSLPPSERREQEANLLLSNLPPHSFLIALDEHGKMLSTATLGEKINQWQQGHKNLIFLIGGPDGHAETLLKKADMTWALSALTFPHLLVRTILAEQLYRVQSLSTGHPYHRV